MPTKRVVGKGPTSKKTHAYHRFASQHARLGLTGTFHISFKTMRELIAKHVEGNKALDFGCGNGRSTRFLKGLGFDTIGIDISKAQLREAVRLDPSGKYKYSKSGSLRGIKKNSMNLVLSNIVFPEIQSREKMIAILKQMKRVLAPKGKIIIVATTPEAYQHDWASYRGKHPENRNMQSGELGKLTIPGTDIVFYDYIWTEKDYLTAFKNAGLKVIAKRRPLGRISDGIEYISETKKPFWQIFVLG